MPRCGSGYLLLMNSLRAEWSLSPWPFVEILHWIFVEQWVQCILFAEVFRSVGDVSNFPHFKWNFNLNLVKTLIDFKLTLNWLFSLRYDFLDTLKTFELGPLLSHFTQLVRSSHRLEPRAHWGPQHATATRGSFWDDGSVGSGSLHGWNMSPAM